ncbi:MAG: hypothetical protein AABW73_01900 [Nanoarchaeota archaeon]|mgnify:CR=1 FL=1
MGEVIRSTKFMADIINTGTIKNYQQEKPFLPEKDEFLERNITLGNEELIEKKKRDRRNALAVALIVVLSIIIVMFGLFTA